MAPRVVVLDHGMGNLRSVAKALQAAGAEVLVSADPDAVRRSDALCVPGQGIFGRCVEAIDSLGVRDAIVEQIESGRPYLGICLGLQVLFERSEEGAGLAGLALLAGEVTRLPDKVSVPHMGWNTVNGTYYYFDHSYAAHPRDEDVVVGWCEHGDRFAAWVEHGSVTGVQFHPEKSGRDGIALLERWLDRL